MARATEGRVGPHTERDGDRVDTRLLSRRGRAAPRAGVASTRSGVHSARVRRLGIGSALGLLFLGHALLWASVHLFIAIAIAARQLDYADAARAVTSDPLPLGAAQLAALGAVIALGVWLSTPGEAPASALGIAPARTRSVVLAAVAGIALQLPMVELTTLIVRLVPTMAHAPEVDAAATALARISSPVRAFTVPFTFVVIAPVTEELLFRGLIQRALRARYGPRVAIGTSALLFGAFHLDAQALFFATIVGVVLGVVAQRAGSTLPAIALHAGFNAVPVLVPPELVAIPGFNDGTNADVPWPLAVASALLAALALGLLARTLRPPRDPRDRPD